jgi:hypothetical protein
MAHILDSFPDDLSRGGKQKYPWDDWLNGQVWQLNKGVDYSSTPAEFRSQVYTAARKHKVSVRCAVLGNNILVIQASTVDT